ncbi:NifB/NifX family molybdenum-iron cluster-binding protein [Methanobrevibacter filiformis]|uniref:Dinitrogenase iron-molybdenum cofactor n=1 Tax=Methanobrevibacter filiformis TaxID=55758 RepID=A0A166DUA5_9EURY|nr:NifB/NifX family molybdenum-iron cluster-binding protein [Methanobrevibacter filiformis]KZX15959.1 dinitrogenase iron-molybdenum cofactor [Methanobrevibacter filiformis]
MKIAVASTDGNVVDLHFGDTNQFFIFNIKSNENEFEEIRKKTDITLEDHTERWRSSIDLIDDCKAVICRKIGKEPHIELRKMGIKAISLDCKVKDAVKECSKHLKID